MKCTLLAACLLACASLAQAQERVIGLLALPEAFGHGPCVPFTPADVPLYATPEAVLPMEPPGCGALRETRSTRSSVCSSTG